jgi:hypothetical protein
MKSYSFILVFALLVITSCGKREDPSPFVDANDQSVNIDSLKKVIQEKDTVYEKIRLDYHSWVTHTFDTEKQCLLFAQIVRKNPKNAVFNEGWVIRKFKWAHEWKKKELRK